VNGSTFSRHGLPVVVASKPSTLTRGMIVSVSSSRIAFAPAASVVSERMISSAVLETVNPLPC